MCSSAAFPTDRAAEHQTGTGQERLRDASTPQAKKDAHTVKLPGVNFSNSCPSAWQLGCVGNEWDWGSRMSQVEQSNSFSNRHRALANRLVAITPSLFPDRHVRVCDHAEGSDKGTARSIIVDRDAQQGITLSGNSARLVYDDPMSEASMAAIVALLCAGRGPVAADPASLSVLALADRLAQTDIPVLINGPTGTGKEVLSNFIHSRSGRKDKPFIAINCAAIPEAMLEAMLFGHEKGSFTGANAAGEGFFRAADGGTLLLDEIAEMPLTLQAKLLRALQEGEVTPIGATKPIKVDVRIIACANRDLPLEIQEGRFRADLYYRLNVFALHVAALQDRRGDIAPLAFAMILRHHTKGETIPWLSDEAAAMLVQHDWPGNVRELENVVRRALVLAQGEAAIEPQHILFDTSARPLPAVHKDNVHAISSRNSAAKGSERKLSNIVQQSEATAIIETLEANRGHRAKAARQLGISERTLRYRLASFREAGIAMGAC